MAKSRKKKASSYDASSIQTLTAIEGIRKRPAMYIGDSGIRGMHHLLREVVDNSIDEHLAGFCTRISVTINTRTNTCTSIDTGRGIPVGKNAQGKNTLIEVVTKTHSGGKFDDDSAVYSVSGGLHGVGITCVNALSTNLRVVSYRDGKSHTATFEQGIQTGKIVVKRLKKARRGTLMEFTPDPEIFDEEARFDPETIAEWLKAKAYMLPKLRIFLTVDGNKTELTQTSGLPGYLIYKQGKVQPVFDTPLVIHVKGAVENGKFVRKARGVESFECALWWTDGDASEVYSFVNMVPVGGGKHVTGMRRAIARAIMSAIPESRRKKVTAEDTREGFRAVVSLRLKRVEYLGQTKDSLANREADSMASGIVGDALERFLKKNPKLSKILADRAVAIAAARHTFKSKKKIATQEAYHLGGTRGLPESLTIAPDCTVAEREVLIVEGDSAGGSAKQGRNSHFQEILKLTGKPPNSVSAWEKHAGMERLFNHKAIKALIYAIGAGHDTTVSGESCDPSRARVSKVIILADADPDGGHIEVLLLVFFALYMRPLIDAGMLYVVHPPLFMVAGNNENRVFAMTRESALEKAISAGIKKPDVQRLKGLGEMQPDQLADTCLNPKTRNMTQVKMTDDGLAYLVKLLGAKVDTRKELLGVAAK